ncbi:hypothetical protein O3Q51_13535 [Cryomorphaceae bacterium 1068]|nr:hypothetical protein [Cryomorphaceae bacterium 1068]
MLNSTYKVFFFLSVSLLFSGCQKSDDPSDGIQEISQVKILGDWNVANSHTVVAGNGVYILLFSDVESQYIAKLMTNEGAELWTKNISEETGLIASEESLAIEEGLYDTDGTFVFFSHRRLFKIDLQGEVVYDNPDFLSAFSSGVSFISILNAFVTSDGGYLVTGSIRVGTGNTRAYYTKYSKEGDVIFSKTYFIDTGGNMGITGAVEQDGFYMLGGYYSVTSGTGNNQFYLLKISSSGKLVWAQNHSTLSTDFFYPFSYEAILGRELIPLANEQTMYIMVPPNEFMADRRSKGFILDETGAVVDSIFFDLSDSNAAGGAHPGIGKGIVQTNENCFVGIINPIASIEGTVLPNEINVPINYEIPNFGYVYTIDAFGRIEDMKYVNRSLSNTFTAIALLSNGNTLIFGVQASINNEVRLILITNK